MSPEFIAIIAVGVSLLGFMLTSHLRMERRNNRIEDRIDRLEENTNRRTDRLEENTNRRVDQLEESTNRRIDRLEENTNRRIDHLEVEVKQYLSQIDARLRMVEQNQAHLAGELSSIRELLRLQPVGLD